MNNSRKVCIAISIVCLVVLGALFLSWRNRSVKEAEMTASERQKNNAEISSIYKRKVEEAKTATELPGSETTETAENPVQNEKENPASVPDVDQDENIPAGTEADKEESAAGQRSAQEESSRGAYQMLKNKMPLHLLVVGDGIAAGRGASKEDSGWPELLAAGFERRFGSEVTLTKAAMDQASVFTTYAEVMGDGTDDQESYDMAVICCGREDNENGFGAGYEAVIRAIHKKYPACTVLSVKEHDLARGSAIDEAQDQINKAYKIKTADMREAFTGHEGELLDQAGYPNDDGHKTYAKKLFAVIYKQMEKDSKGQVPDREPVLEDTSSYENYTYYGADQFKKISNVSYELTTGPLNGILGIDYLAYDRDESVSLSLDGQSFALSALNLTESSQRVIRLVKSSFTVNDKITVSFRDKEQADAFGGLIVTRP